MNPASIDVCSPGPRRMSSTAPAAHERLAPDRRAPAPRALAPRPARRAILRAWLNSVSSSRFIGRRPELAELERVARRGRRREAVDGLRRGRVGGRQDAPAERADRRRRGARTLASWAAPASSSARTSSPTPPWSPRCGRCSAPATRCWPSSRTSTRAELARLIPELGEPPGRARGRARRGPAAPLRRPPRADRDPRRRAAGAAVDRGHPLGRPLDPLLPALPRGQPHRGAGAGRRHLPLRRAPPPPSAAAAAGRARAQPLRASGSSSSASTATSSPTSSPTSSGPRPTGTWSSACTGAARATRCSPRSCSPPASTPARALPPSLREALLLRVERLPAETQRLLRLLAVAGRADDALLADAGGVDPAELSALDARGDRGPDRRRRRQRALRLPPRAAARGALRRPAARRALGASPDPGARARARRRGGRRRLERDRHRPPLLLRRRPAPGARRGAGRGARGAAGARLRRGGGAAGPRARALASGSRPRASSRTPTTPRC